MKNDLHVLFVPFDTSGFREVFYYVHSKIPANMVNQVSQGYIIVGTDLLPAEYCRDHVPQGMQHRQAHPAFRHLHPSLCAELGVCLPDVAAAAELEPVPAVNGDPTPMATSPPAAALGVPAPRSPVAHSVPKPSPANTLGGGKDNFNNRRDAAFANRDRERGDRDREPQFHGNRDQSFGNRDRPDNFNSNRPDAFGGGRDRGPPGGPRDNSLGEIGRAHV